MPYIRSGLFVLLLMAVGACTPPERVELRLTDDVELPPRSVVIFLVDGLDLVRLDQMMAAGELPNIHKRFVRQGIRVRHAVTSLPSTTYPNCTSVITGVYPGHHGIVGNFWFDRNSLSTRYYMTLDTYRTSNEHFTAPTLFEMLPDHFSVSIQAHTRRGVAERIDNRTMFALAWFFGNHSYADHYVALRFEEVEDIAERFGRWPSLILTYYPGVDEVGHHFGSDSPEYGRALRTIDDVVGMVIDEIEDEDMLERTIFVLVADHSHLPIGDQRRQDMVAWLREQRGLRVYSRLLHQSRLLARADRLADYDVLGGLDADRVVMFHLKGSGGWIGRPTPQEVEAFILQEPSLVEVPAVLAALMRLGPGRVQVLSRHGRAVVERKVEDGVELYRLVNVEGDPVGHLADAALRPMVETGWHDAQTWLKASVRSNYPDFVVQAVNLFDSPHTGDVVLLAAEDWAFADQEGGHGSCTPREMFIPLFFAGADLPRGAEIGPARIVDVVPTIMGLLGEGKRLAHYRLDGRDLSAELYAAGSRADGR